MTNLLNAFTNWGAPAIAGLLAATAATTGISAETSKVDTKSQKTERLTRSTSRADHGSAQLRVRGGKMETRVQNGKLVLTGFAGDLGGGKVHLTGNMPVGTAGEKEAALKFADVSVTEAGKLLGKPELVAWLGNASLSGTIKGEWNGEGVAQISRSANGALSIVAGKGEITDKAVLEKLGDLAGISDLKQLRFDSVKLTAHAEDGVIVIDSARISGPDLNLAMAGEYSTSADELDLKIAMAVSPEIASRSSYLKLKNVFGFLKGEDDTAEKTENGFVKVPLLLVSGELKDPDVKLDKAKVVADSAKPAPEVKAEASTEGKADGFLGAIKEIANSAGQ